jgi:hypothetical protein
MKAEKRARPVGDELDQGMLSVMSWIRGILKGALFLESK